MRFNNFLPCSETTRSGAYCKCRPCYNTLLFELPVEAHPSLPSIPTVRSPETFHVSRLLLRFTQSPHCYEITSIGKPFHEAMATNDQLVGMAFTRHQRPPLKPVCSESEPRTAP